MLKLQDSIITPKTESISRVAAIVHLRDSLSTMNMSATSEVELRLLPKHIYESVIYTSYGVLV